MTRPTETQQEPTNQAGLRPVTTLALWSLRRSRSLLLFICLGMLVAITLVDALPLYTQVTTTAGLRSALTGAPTNADVIVHSISDLVSPGVFTTVDQKVRAEIQRKLGPYLNPASHFSIEVSPEVIRDPRTLQVPNPIIPNQVQLVSEPIATAQAHLHLLSGRLPREQNAQIQPLGRSNYITDLEIAITPEEADVLHLRTGSTLIMREDFEATFIPYSGIVGKNYSVYLRLHVVGTFAPPPLQDTFWHQNAFHNVFLPPAVPRGPHPVLITALVSNQQLFSAYAQFSSHAGVLGNNQGPGATLAHSLNMFWLYRFDPARISSADLDPIVQAVTTVQIDLPNDLSYSPPPYFKQTEVFLPSDILSQYQARIAVARVPIAALLCLVIGMALFFVNAVSALLIEQQREAIALLRSRGTSRSQLYGAFLLQGLALGVIALLGGVGLALLLVEALVGLIPGSGQQGALQVVMAHPLTSLLGQGWLLLATVALSILSLLAALPQALRLNVLALRREAARTGRQPLWQRLHLDAIALALSLVVAVLAAYLTTSELLDPHTRQALLAPLTLLSACCLALAIILLLLRFFPLLLSWSARVAARGRSAAPVLALAQMARAPRQPLRLVLLLSCATAFLLFSLLFVGSQNQRAQDVASYEAGADFSGAPVLTGTPDDLQTMTTEYRQIPGVRSATPGYAGTLRAGPDANLSIALRAVDAATFAQSATWTAQDSTQPLNALMQQLLAQRARVASLQRVPAIIDEATAETLHLEPGASFRLSTTSRSDETSVTIPFVVVAIVAHIPTISAQAGASGSAVPGGGVLVDYPSLVTVQTPLAEAAGSDFLPINYLWLRSGEDAASLQSVRAALSHGNLQLNPLYDRRLLLANLQREPLAQSLLGILAVGSLAMLLLGLLGSLLVSWQGARQRLITFAVLRALGTAPQQVLSVLLWEQGLIYGAGIGLGLLSGALLSKLVIPLLVFSGAPTSGVSSDLPGSLFYVTQSTPPVQLVISPLAGAAPLALLVIGIAAVLLLGRLLLRPLLTQTLRLNED